jgi:uncharacterized membrane protein YccF (DUF307 family)
MQPSQNPYGTPDPYQPQWQSQMPHDGSPLGMPQYEQPTPQYGQPMPQYGQPPQGMPQYGQPMPQSAMNFASTSVNVNIQQNSPGCLTRGLYYIFIGWWLGFLWLNLGFFLCFMIITLPLGLVMLNRLPQVLTLRPSGTSTNVNVSSTMTQSSGSNVMMNTVNVNVNGTVQYSFLVRALYYVFVGWWAGYIWAFLGYLCCLSIVLLPVGLLMLNRLPMVLTLRRN